MSDQERWSRQSRWFEERVRFNKSLGLRVRQWDDEQVVFELPYAEWLCNSSDGLHGGVVGALADACGTAAALGATGHEGMIATVSMSINYLGVATTDLVATGVCVKPGRRLQVSNVEVRDMEGRLVAQATVTSTISENVTNRG